MSQRINSKGLRKLVIGALAVVLLVLVIPSHAFAKARSWRTYSVKVDSGYLALRTHPSYDSRNEIGQLYTGDVVSVLDASSDQDYWVVYSYKYSRRGWVNQHYLRYLDNTPKGNYRVKVDKGYLALRTRPTYDDSNEIGKRYTGDVVIVKDKSQGQYWWVYSPKHQRDGFVNKDYLY